MRARVCCGKGTIVLAILIAVVLCSPTWADKNVIRMIADGEGFNVFDAARMYQGKWDPATKRGTQVYDAPGWVKYACSTFPLNTSKKPLGTGVQDPVVIYSSAKAWDKVEGYAWLKAGYTDSAAAATALSTAQKTFNNAINWSDKDAPIQPTITEAAKAAGKAAGVITTVEWSHATPAGASNAHVAERDDYESIANQMLEGGVLDVIMGAGNPDFNNNGEPWQVKKPIAKKKPIADAKADGKKTDDAKQAARQGGEDKQEYKYVGGRETWLAIEAARARPGDTYQGFRPVSTKAEFEALTSGPAPAKVLGTAQAATTLQQARAAATSDDPTADTPLNANVPSLATMVRGAINVLDENPKGFFLMVEGGAVDWANHKNQPGRMLQEMADFNTAVEAVVQWVETHSNWSETMVIITADHETGLLWGPNSDTKPFDPIVNLGPGKVPGLKYHSKSHTNSLVPVYARGTGSEKLSKSIVAIDPVRGAYVDNTTIGRVLHAAVAGTELRPADSGSKSWTDSYSGRGRRRKTAK